MNLNRITGIITGGLVLAGLNLSAKPATEKRAPVSDLATIEARRSIVDMANNLAKQENPPPLPDQIPLPFNPSGFNRTIREVKTDAGPVVIKPVGDREILAALATKITPSGTFIMGGERFLQFSKNRLKVGHSLHVMHEGQEYTLELTGIDATNFTLRLNREEITRPIKPGKNP